MIATDRRQIDRIYGEKFNAKTQSRKGAEKENNSLASLR